MLYWYCIHVDSGLTISRMSILTLYCIFGMIWPFALGEFFFLTRYRFFFFCIKIFLTWSSPLWWTIMVSDRFRVFKTQWTAIIKKNRYLDSFSFFFVCNQKKFFCFFFCFFFLKKNLRIKLKLINHIFANIICAKSFR